MLLISTSTSSVYGETPLQRDRACPFLCLLPTRSLLIRAIMVHLPFDSINPSAGPAKRSQGPASQQELLQLLLRPQLVFGLLLLGFVLVEGVQFLFFIHI